MRSFTRACVLSLGVLLCLAGVTTQAKPKTYQITIESTPPGATVYLDKETKPVGITPLTLSLKPEIYLIDIKLDGYEGEFDILEIDGPPKQQAFSYTLVRFTSGSIFVSTEQNPAEVFVDGVFSGQTPINLKKLRTGPHSLLLKKDGYESHAQQISISESEVPFIKATLALKQLGAIVGGQVEAPAPIYLMSQGSCCSQAIRHGSGGLLGVWGQPKGKLLFAVGEGGTIERSTNLGASWSPITSGTTEDLTAIWGNGATIIVVGKGGTILRSVDSGASWVIASSNTTQALYGVWGSSVNDVYAVGASGTILSSSNQGETWTLQESGAYEDLFGVFGLSPSEVYAVGEHGKILGLRGGVWLTLQSDTINDLYAVLALPKGALLAVGRNGTIVRSTDRASWYQQKKVSNDPLYALWRGSDGTLYIAGDVLLRSNDEGLSWSKVSENICSRAVWAPPSGALVLVGR